MKPVNIIDGVIVSCGKVLISEQIFKELMDIEKDSMPVADKWQFPMINTSSTK